MVMREHVAWEHLIPHVMFIHPGKHRTGHHELVKLDCSVKGRGGI